MPGSRLIRLAIPRQSGQPTEFLWPYVNCTAWMAHDGMDGSVHRGLLDAAGALDDLVLLQRPRVVAEADWHLDLAECGSLASGIEGAEWAAREVSGRRSMRQDVHETTRLVHVPVTEYRWETYLAGRWNPFSQPYYAQRLVPRTALETRAEVVKVPVTQRRLVPETRIEKVPETVRWMEKKRSSSRSPSIRRPVLRPRWLLGPSAACRNCQRSAPRRHGSPTVVGPCAGAELRPVALPTRARPVRMSMPQNIDLTGSLPCNDGHRWSLCCC